MWGGRNIEEMKLFLELNIEVRNCGSYMKIN